MIINLVVFDYADGLHLLLIEIVGLQIDVEGGIVHVQDFDSEFTIHRICTCDGNFAVERGLEPAPFHVCVFDFGERSMLDILELVFAWAPVHRTCEYFVNTFLEAFCAILKPRFAFLLFLVVSQIAAL